MIQIRKEVDDIIIGKQPKDNNVLKNAPHPISVITLPESAWNRYGVSLLEPHTPSRWIIYSPYERETAVYPLPYLRDRKFWPSVSRIDDGTKIVL